MNSCEVEAEPVVQSNAVMAVTLKSDPMLAEILDIIKRQQVQIDDLSQTLSSMQGGGGRSDRPRQQPAFDSSGRPICFKCQMVGHIARYYTSFTRLPPTTSGTNEGAAHVSEQQGNSPPLW